MTGHQVANHHQMVVAVMEQLMAVRLLRSQLQMNQ
jgi:hypothetical protein